MSRMVNLKRNILSLLFFLLPCIFMAANNVVADKEEYVASLFKTILESRHDSVRLSMANEMQAEMRAVIDSADNLDCQLFEQQNNIGKITAQDNSMRLYTWNIPLSDSKTLFYAIFKSYKSGKIYTLSQTQTYHPADNGIISGDNWYGALYYELIPIKYEIDRQRVEAYIAFGWYPGSTDYTNCKIIEVIVLCDDTVQLGAPIFYDENTDSKQTRLIFEYYKQTLYTIDYDESKNRILFNNLMPIFNLPDGRQIFAPDEIFNAIVLKKDLWYRKENVNTRNRSRKYKIN